MGWYPGFVTGKRDSDHYFVSPSYSSKHPGHYDKLIPAYRIRKYPKRRGEYPDYG